MADIYDRTFRTLDKDWLHNKVQEIMWSKKPDIADKDLSVVCRWLRGFHRHVYDNTGDYWQAYTQPYHQFGPWSCMFIKRYLVDNWVFLVDHLPTIPSSPSESFPPIDENDEIVRETVQQRALL